MLMALLYSDQDRIAAAAPASDQAPYGDEYWSQYHAAEIDPGEGFETTYVTIAKPDLQSRLLALGIDRTIDGVQIAKEVGQGVAPSYSATNVQ